MWRRQRQQQQRRRWKNIGRTQHINEKQLRAKHAHKRSNSNMMVVCACMRVIETNCFSVVSSHWFIYIRAHSQFVVYAVHEWICQCVRWIHLLWLTNTYSNRHTHTHIHLKSFQFIIAYCGLIDETNFQIRWACDSDNNASVFVYILIINSLSFHS